ncbi:MAG: hypothetical protein HYY02_13105 [Chloroflexi bacterium]|nr:hypothetical protein [Chloroflexota bacterium]
MVTASEMEQQRSPGTLRTFVDGLIESVRADDSERHRDILKEGRYKVVLEELVPLSRFSVLAYPESYKIQLVLGNQGYDALVFNETGQEVDRVEITTPHDGVAKAQNAKLVVTRGYGKVHVGTPGDDFDALLPHVLSTRRNKAQKDYSDCTLVIAIAPLPPFPSFESQYEKQIETRLNDMFSDPLIHHTRGADADGFCGRAELPSGQGAGPGSEEYRGDASPARRGGWG